MDASRPRAASYNAGGGDFVGPTLPPNHPELALIQEMAAGAFQDNSCAGGSGDGGGESKGGGGDADMGERSHGGGNPLADARAGDGAETIDRATAVAMAAMAEGDAGARTSGMTDEQAYEASARAIADKVQRQQEGKESSMLGQEHADQDFRTVDEIQAMLDEQLRSVKKVAGVSKPKPSSRYGSGGYGSGGYGGSYYDSSAYGSGGYGGGRDDDADDGRGNAEADAATETSELLGAWFRDRCQYIPLRLTYEERKSLRLIQALMKASEYTDLVDAADFKNEMKRNMTQLKCLRAGFTGIIASFDYRTAQKLCDGAADFSEPGVATVLRKALEVARRYKVMNPEKMRAHYGKLMYLLQDACSTKIADQIGFNIDLSVKTVYSMLEAGDALELLSHRYLSTATREILPEGKTRSSIQREIKLKEDAKKYLIRTFAAKTRLDKDEIERCLNSIGDNQSFLNSNRGPIDFVLDFLGEHFAPGKEGTEEGGECCLAIYGGKNDARLTHTHERQFMYVLQSLTLWREIINDLFRLWYLAEEDLLDPRNPYKLVDTGQGDNRLQACPRVSKVMHSILYAVQQKTVGVDAGTNGWVGSSVIHLGDTNVPNALMFIDKYNQVSRILNPIVQAVKLVDPHWECVHAGPYLRKAYTSALEAKKTVLADFFRGAFDGSGADNFFEAGSCIDGRLTSAWNWCQHLPEKRFFPLFQLAGFRGFDGEFQA